MTALSINLNKIALLRNSRPGNYPNVLDFGRMALNCGVQGITLHPRPDQRHIRPMDIYDISKLLQETNHCEFNIEGNPFAAATSSYPGLLSLVETVKPQQCTLVPDSLSQLTSDHGFDLKISSEKLKPIIEQLRAWNIRISLFMDPDIQQIDLAKELGSDRIELYTGPYAKAFHDLSTQNNSVFDTYRIAAEHAQSIGLGVNAGHDLNLDNLPLFLSIPNILEVSIGHALTVDALTLGFDAAVRAYLKLCCERP